MCFESSFAAVRNAFSISSIIPIALNLLIDLAFNPNAPPNLNQ